MDSEETDMIASIDATFLSDISLAINTYKERAVKNLDRGDPNMMEPYLMVQNIRFYDVDLLRRYFKYLKRINETELTTVRKEVFKRFGLALGVKRLGPTMEKVVGSFERALNTTLV